MTEPSTEIVPATPRTGAEVAMMDRATDSWTVVLQDVADLAYKIADTDFVPKDHRGNRGQVAAVILHGRELGLPPMTALASTYVVHGRPSISAEAMRALILQHGHEIAVEESTSARCTIRGRRAGSEQWTSVTWTLDDAKRAGGLLHKDTWKSYPRQMLTARATAELARLIFPDVIHGMRALEEMDDVTPWEGPTTDVEQSAAPATTKVRRQPRKAVEAAPAPATEQQQDTPPADPQPAPERRRPDLPTRAARPPENHDTPAATASEAGAEAPNPPASDPAPNVEAGAVKGKPAPASADVETGAPSPAPVATPSVEDQQAEVRQLSAEKRQLAGTPAEPADVVDAEVIDTADRRKITGAQRATIMMHFARLKLVEDRAMRLTYTAFLSGRDRIESTNELTFAQASDVIKALEKCRDLDALEQLANGQQSLT